MSLLDLVLSVLTVLGLEHEPAGEESVRLLLEIIWASDAAEVPRDLVTALCAHASSLGLEDTRACGCGRSRDPEDQAVCMAQRLVSGRSRCGTYVLAVQRVLSGSCRGGIEQRRTVYRIRRRLLETPLMTWSPD